MKHASKIPNLASNREFGVGNLKNNEKRVENPEFGVENPKFGFLKFLPLKKISIFFRRFFCRCQFFCSGAEKKKLGYSFDAENSYLSIGAKIRTIRAF